MSSAETTRQRRKDAPVAKANERVEKATLAARAKAEDSAFSLTDVARTIVFLLLASSALSYFVTRESFTWGVKRPGWASVGGIKSLIVSCLLYRFICLLCPFWHPLIVYHCFFRHNTNWIYHSRPARKHSQTPTSKPTMAATQPSPSTSPSTEPSTTSPPEDDTTDQAAAITSSQAKTPAAHSSLTALRKMGTRI